MRRLRRFQNARMLSARVERDDADKLESILSQQYYLTLQDFINYAVTLFISGTIKTEGKEFVLNTNQPPTEQ